MATLWKDLCREILPPARQHYDYGLWLPAPKYRAESTGGNTPKGHDVFASDDGGDLIHSDSGISEVPLDIVNPVVPGKKSPFDEEFDKASNNQPRLNIDKIGDVSRKLGLAPSIAEINAFKANHAGKEITKDEMKSFIATVVHQDDTPDKMVGFFAQYDQKRGGMLSKQQLKNLLRSFGEPMSETELQSLFEVLGYGGSDDNQLIDYKEFAERLVQQQ